MHHSVVRWSVLSVLALLWPGATAEANPYESFVDVETEQDLYDAVAARQISSETFERLLDLRARGVDLERASRQELYELPNLTYAQVDAILAYRQHGELGEALALARAGVLTEREAAAIAPFVLARPGAGWRGLRGWVQASSRASLHDQDLPPAGLRVRAAGFGSFTIGIAATLTRLRLGAVSFDPARQALVAEAPAVRPALPKAYLRWEDARWTALVGTYRAGFGQRLVFDNTGAELPSGIVIDDQLISEGALTRGCKEVEGEVPSPCTGAAADLYVTPDVRWREGLLGVAVAARRLALGPGQLQLVGWGSYQPRPVYQYELVDRGRCADPRQDADPGCAAPRVYRRPSGDLSAPTTRYSYQTLPGVLTERLLGGNATYALDRRTRVGVTGYVAQERSAVAGIALDTQEWSRLPTGGRFGALGAEVATGRGRIEGGVEVARSFDRLGDAPGPVDGGGGLGAVARLAAASDVQELEVSVRYYQVDFVNPFGRPVAAADELEGQRARDEAGLRARYVWATPRAAVRAGLDVWLNPSTETPKLSSYLRAELQAHPRWRWGAALGFDDKDLRHGGRQQCFELATEVSATGESIPCRGQQLTSSVRVAAQLSPALELVAQLQHEVLDAGRGDATGFRQDLSAWLLARYRSARGLQVRAQLRYRDDDVVGRGAVEQALAGNAELRLPLLGADQLRLRLDARVELTPVSSDPSTPRSRLRALALALGYDRTF